MFSKIIQYVLVLSICFTPLFAVAATAEEAKSLLEEAVAFYQEKGKDLAFEEFSKPDSKFTRGDLYIAVLDAEGTLVAHGANPSLIGQVRIDQQDVNGKEFVREMMQITQSGDSVDYEWWNPVKKSVGPKTSYIYLVDGYRFVCGIYR